MITLSICWALLLMRELVKFWFTGEETSGNNGALGETGGGTTVAVEPEEGNDLCEVITPKFKLWEGRKLLFWVGVILLVSFIGVILACGAELLLLFCWLAEPSALGVKLFCGVRDERDCWCANELTGVAIVGAICTCWTVLCANCVKAAAAGFAIFHDIWKGKKIQTYDFCFERMER